jgi:large subunit ribosomal protein L17
MRHQVRGNRLNRSADHKRAMLRNMVTSLFAHERIETTITKAKEARRYAERMITFAKRGDLGARRQAARFVNDPKVLQKLFAEIGPRYADRPGGYTRVMRTTIRKGDDAQLAILELVEQDFTPKPKREKKQAAPKAAKPEPAPAEEATDSPEVEETDKPTE